jgi:hypothetical protein
MKAKTFCEHCWNEEEYRVETAKNPSTFTKDGISITYQEQKAFCLACNHEVYVPEIMDENLNRIQTQFRKAKNLVSLELVINTPNKYHIGKRPLSLLLGWGELTYSRFIDGALPTRCYSDLIDIIYHNPKIYQNILEKNKNLISDVAYRKSKKAVQELLGHKSNR